MTIAELQVKQGNVDIVVEVAEKGEIREFEKFGKPGKVCNAKVKDDSGEIALTLWNEDINKVSVGDKIKITNGFVNEWQGEKQLTTGRFGSLEILDGEGAPTEEAVGTEESAPAKAPTEEAPAEKSSEEKPVEEAPAEAPVEETKTEVEEEKIE